MKANKVIGNGITGVNVYFSIGDLIVLAELTREIHETYGGETPANELGNIVNKVIDGGLNVHAAHKDLTNPEVDIFEEDDNDSSYSQEDLFHDVEQDKKDLEHYIEQLSDKSAGEPKLKVVGKIDLDKSDTKE